MPRKPKTKVINKFDELLPKEKVEPSTRYLKFKALNDEQQSFINKIRDNTIIFCEGYAGVGKTHIACGSSLDLINRQIVEKATIIKPTLEAGESLGHYPGELNEKLFNFIQNFIGEYRNFLSGSDLKMYLDTGIIDACSVGLIRGRTFKKSIIIVDECQNLTYPQMKLVLTRLGEGSKMVLLADPKQSDLKSWQQGAFEDAVERLEGIDGVAYQYMKESVRHPLIDKILTRLSDDDFNIENSY